MIAARNVEDRERLLRYVARPMVVGERVSELADGPRVRLLRRKRTPDRGTEGLWSVGTCTPHSGWSRRSTRVAHACTASSSRIAVLPSV